MYGGIDPVYGRHHRLSPAVTDPLELFALVFAGLSIDLGRGPGGTDRPLLWFGVPSKRGPGGR